MKTYYINRTFLSFILCFFSVLTPIHAESADKKANSETVPNANYRVGPGDVLEITVWKEEDLVKQVVVPPDGLITFPHAGSIDANNKTVEQIRQALVERLSEIIVDPIVTVFLQSFASNKVYVLGKVNRPGEFPITGRVDVMQALAMAGGMASFADKDTVKILRRENGILHAISFDYTEVADGEQLDQNIILQKGDVVVVQ